MWREQDGHMVSTLRNSYDFCTMRIYMDINVFATLRDSNRKADLDYLIEQKRHHVFLFSDAHLDDLNRDATDMKFMDLEFMQRLVDSNYLVHVVNEKLCNIFMVAPIEAFSNRQFIDLSGIGDLLSGADMDGLFGQLFSTLRELVLPLNLASNIAGMQGESREFWLRLIPNPKDVYTLGEWLDLSSAFLQNLVEDKRYYKGIRGTFADALLKVDFKDTGNDFKLSDGQGNHHSLLSILRKGVDDANKDKTAGLYDYVFSAFLMLNLFGLDGEKNKKAIFSNTHTDADHAFFGGHCDYVVSNDTGFVVKANMVYSMFESSTVAMTLDQLLIRLRYQHSADNRTATSFLKSLKHDLVNAFVTPRPSIANPLRTYSYYHTKSTYLDYFNELEGVKEVGTSGLRVSKVDRTWAYFTMYSEFALLVNKLIVMFGMDELSLGTFGARDIEELRQENWSGRYWNIYETRLGVGVTNSTGRMHFYVSNPEN